MEKQLIEEISDGVATLTFNRPGHRLNALSTPIMEGLLEALPRLAASPARGRTSIALPAHHRERVALLKHKAHRSRHGAGNRHSTHRTSRSKTGHGPCAHRRAIIAVASVLHLHEMLRCFSTHLRGSSLPQDDLIGPS
jgi:hypothetical protein